MRTLFAEFTREAKAAQVDYTIDGLVIQDDDTAYAVAYDAAGSDYTILKGTREPEGICFSVAREHYEHPASALEAITRALEGYPLDDSPNIN
jgi:hypothetical protein